MIRSLQIYWNVDDYGDCDYDGQQLLIVMQWIAEDTTPRSEWYETACETDEKNANSCVVHELRCYTWYWFKLRQTCGNRDATSPWSEVSKPVRTENADGCSVRAVAPTVNAVAKSQTEINVSWSIRDQDFGDCEFKTYTISIDSYDDESKRMTTAIAYWHN